MPKYSNTEQLPCKKRNKEKGRGYFWKLGQANSLKIQILGTQEI